VRSVPFERPLAEAFEIKAGRAARWQAFSTVEEAHEAAGRQE
jgi:hypothetical protein